MYFIRELLPARSAVVVLFTLCLLWFDSASAQDLSTLGGDVISQESPVNRARVMVLKPDLSDTLAVMFTNGEGRFESAFVANVGTESEVPIAATENHISALYPNPVEPGRSQITVAYRTVDNTTAQPTPELFDVLGRVVQTTRSVASGVYFVRLRFDDETATQPKSLVVTSTGLLTLVVRRDDSPAASETRRNSGKAGSVLSNDPTSPTSAIVRVEKDGLITQEANITLDPASPAEIDFSLEEAPAPFAIFAIDGAQSPIVGEPILFDGSESFGDNKDDFRYSWAFGDGQMGTGRKIAHVYSQGGTFDITLTVTGDYGARANTTLQLIVDDLPEPVSSSGILTGRVRDVDGFGLPDVAVTIVGSTRTGISDLSGAVLVEDVDVGVSLAVRLAKPGYTAQVVKLGVPADTTSTLYFEASLRQRDNSMEVEEAENGFVRVARDGVKIDMPFDALVRSDGSPVTGAIDVSMTPVNVADTNQVRSFPGRFEGVTPDGSVTPIVSFGVAEFAFEQEGEPLQLAAGKTAKVEIPIYTSGAAVGDSIPSWSMNETTGSWVQEGTGVVKESSASPSGLALSVEVGHFTWWNCDAEPDERNEGTGLCFKYECFAGNCYKVKVYCWVEGAQRGNLDKRDDLPPPVFTVREYWPEAGGSFVIPGNVVTTMRGTTIDGNAILRGDTTFTPLGGGTSSIELILDTVATASELTLPASVQGTLDTDTDTQFYTFYGTEGQVIAYDLQPMGSGFGRITISDPNGTIVQDRAMDGIARPLQLKETGAYSVFVTGSVTLPRTYVLRIYLPSGSVDVNTNNTFALPNGDFRLLRFSADLGQVLNLASFQPEVVVFSPRNRLSVFDSTLSFSRGNSNSLETGDFTANHDGLFLLVESNTDAGEVTFGLSENDPTEVTTAQFDANGSVDIENTLPYHGSRARYTFDATQGDGLEISVHPRGSDPLLGARFSITDPNQNVLSFTPSSGKPGVTLSAHAYTAGVSGTYNLVVDDRTYSSLGDFDFRIRKVTPSSSIVVDDDLACGGAVTTSLTAALLAVQIDGNVTICNGTYEAPSRPILRQDGVTVSGESEAGVIVSYYDQFRSPGTIMEVQGIDVTVRDLTIESEQIGFNYNIGIRSVVTVAGNSATFENITFRPRGENAGMGPAIDGQFKKLTMRNLSYTHGTGGTQSLNVSASDSIRIDNVSLDYPASVRSSTPDGVIVEIDGLEMSDYTMQVQFAKKVLVENSLIEGALEIFTAEEAVVRNNVMNSSTAQVLKVGDIDVALVEGNESNRSFQLVAGTGQVMTLRNNTFRTAVTGSLLTLAANSTAPGGTIVAQNNIIAGVRGPLVNVLFPEHFGDLTVANNTITHEQLGNTVEQLETISVRAVTPSFTGDMSVTFVNNILLGDATTVFALVPNTTIDADYNLYSNYLHVFNDGSNRTGGNDLLGANPLFANDLFQLLTGSPALDSGATPAQYPGVPNIDFNGNARPAGAGYDRGAHEGSVTGTTSARRGN